MFSQGNNNNHVYHLGARVPAGLTYSESQKQYYDEPLFHERNFALMIRDRHGTMEGRAAFPLEADDIRDNYRAGLQTWLRKIANAMRSFSDRNKNATCVCEVAKADICRHGPNVIAVNDVVFRPCVQGFGLIRVAIFQLLLVCKELGRSLSFCEPDDESYRVYKMLFGDSDIPALRNFLYKNREKIMSKITRLVDPYMIDNDDYFNSIPPERINALTNFFFFISYEKISRWSIDNMYEICRVRGMVRRVEEGTNIVIIDPDYLPTANDINDQRIVDERFNIAIGNARLSEGVWYG